MSGWIKIHRDIAKHWIFKDAEKFKWWMDMLFLASYEGNKTNVGSKIVEIKRGQFIGSLSFFMKRWGVGKERIINYLRLLQSDGMIDKVSDKNITIITICNYESYQNVPDNLPDNNSDYHADNLPDNPPDTTKEGKEVKEINNNISNAHTREEKVAWVRDWEESLQERFKAQGCGIAVARATGLKTTEIYQLLDIFMAKCELSNLGHRDLEHFNNRFLKAIQNKRLSLPQQEQSAQQKKVTSNEDTYRLMHEMGWQN